MKKSIPWGCALVVVLAACAANRDALQDEFLPPTSVTTLTTASSTSPPTTLPVGDLEEQVALLAETVDQIRMPGFSAPPIEYRTAAEVDAGYRAWHGLPRTDDAEFDAAYLTMLGVLDAGNSIADLEGICTVPGYYDPDTRTLVMVDGLSELTPLGRRHLVGELTTAATDSSFDWSTVMRSRQEAGDVEAAVALWGLVQGDAAFHADQYAGLVLSATDRFAITLEGIACQQERPNPPGYVTEVEHYGVEVGRAFVEDLISNGGVEAVDAAYQDQPVSSEQIYHPARFADGERTVRVELESISLPGFDEASSGVFGERTFRALLAEGVTPAQALQAATGWGGDSYRVLWDGSTAVLVLVFEGDQSRDARELAETLAGWASSSLRVGSGRPDNKGLVFEGEDYAFVAHAGTSMLLVVSNNAEIGRDARNLFWPEW